MADLTLGLSFDDVLLVPEERSIADRSWAGHFTHGRDLAQDSRGFGGHGHRFGIGSRDRARPGRWDGGHSSSLLGE